MILYLFLAFLQILAITGDPSLFQHDHNPKHGASLTESLGGLRRSKRDWQAPPISILENDKGPFPKQLVKLQSSFSKEVQVVYSISGEGADLPPMGLFTVDRNTGIMYVTKPLDREAKSHYMLHVHAVAVVGGVKEKPVEITINVLDFNDNKPVFTQDLFLGCVSESSPVGFGVMKVNATDADDAVSTDNAEIRYSIVSQDPALPNPNMFAINPVTGEIQVNSDGLDGKKYPKYTLEIQAADVGGKGLVTSGKAVLTVKDCASVPICNVELKPVVLTIGDKDGINAEIIGVSKDLWKAKHNATDVQLTPGKQDSGHFMIVLKVTDSASKAIPVQNKEVCETTGNILY